MIKVSPLVPFDAYLSTLGAGSTLVIANPALFTAKLQSKSPPTMKLIARYLDIKLVLVDSIHELLQLVRHNAFSRATGTETKAVSDGAAGSDGTAGSDEAAGLDGPEVSGLVPEGHLKIALYGVFQYFSLNGQSMETGVHEDLNGRLVARCLMWLYNMAYYRDMDVEVCDDGSLEVDIESSYLEDNVKRRKLEGGAEQEENEENDEHDEHDEQALADQLDLSESDGHSEDSNDENPELQSSYQWKVVEDPPDRVTLDRLLVQWSNSQ